MHQNEISRQVADALKSVAVPADWTEWMLGQLHAGQREDADATAQAVAAIRGEMRDADEKVGRLTTAYVEGAMTLPEYRQAKELLVNR